MSTTSHYVNYPQHHPPGHHHPHHDQPVQLRGTHLYLVLDDVVHTGCDPIVSYLNSIQEQNQTVESVFVKGAMSRDATTPEGRLPPAMALQIFQCLAKFNQMRRLEISGDGRFGGLVLPVSALTLALQQQDDSESYVPKQTLQSLRLGNIILMDDDHFTENNSSMQDLATAVQQLPHLTSVDLVRCRSEAASSLSWAPLLQALSNMTQLQHAMFCETFLGVVERQFPLALLCQSPSLQKLWWKTMPGMTDEHITAMAHQLILRETNNNNNNNNNTYNSIKSHRPIPMYASLPFPPTASTTTQLTELTIRSHGLGRRAGQAMADLLRHNTTLQVINLDLDHALYGLPIVQALQHNNTTLQCLDIWAWAEVGPAPDELVVVVESGEEEEEEDAVGNDDQQQAEAGVREEQAMENENQGEGVAHNGNNDENDNDNDATHVNNLDPNRDNSPQITTVCTTMLQQNYALKFLTFQGLDWSNPQIDFYLRLNRAGRQLLLNEKVASHAMWVETLIQQQHDLDVVFYFLSLNPLVCSFCNQSRSGKRGLSRKRSTADSYPVVASATKQAKISNESDN